MEEEKAAAYYDELTRKGEGAARFKQGLGFSTNSQSAASTSPPPRGSALVSSSSFLGNFVKASSPMQSLKFEKQAQLNSIQNKLKKKPKEQASEKSRSRKSSHRDRSKSRSRERDKERCYTKLSRSRDSRDRSYRRRSRSRERNYMRRSRSRERRSVSPRWDRRSKRRSWSRSLSPRERRRSEKRSGDAKREGAGKERNNGVDYSRLIEGYEKMTPADRVKARMKLQLNETAEKDEGMGSGWERFVFDKDAPLDDEEIEAADDDAALVKHIGQSFRFSAVEARREEKIKAAHDEAMFGAPLLPASSSPDNEVEVENNENDRKDTELASSLLSEKVLAKQQGSWRDRARKA